MALKHINAPKSAEKVLVHADTWIPVKPGDILRSFRGEDVELLEIEPPKHEGSTGRVWVQDDVGHLAGYYPGVYNLVWIAKEFAKAQARGD